MKKNNGVTLISLVITIMIMSILAGMTMVSVRTTIVDAKDGKLAIELGMVRQAIVEQYSKASALGKTEVLAEEDQVEFFVGEKIEDFYDIDLPEQSSVIGNRDVTEFYNMAGNYECEYQEDFYYRVIPEDLKKMGINDAKHTYIVNYKTSEVYNETVQVNSLSELLYLPKLKYDLEKTNSQDFNDWE